jgi:gamma-glutamyltranspeptidase/glutathione hydrolase
MTPTIVKRSGRPVLVLGSPGGPTIINSVLQVLLRVVDGGAPLDRAVAAPRLHHQWVPDRIDVERGAFPPDVLLALFDRGHGLRPRDPMGNVQAIAIDGPRLHAVADPRGWGRAGVVRPE